MEKLWNISIENFIFLEISSCVYCFVMLPSIKMSKHPIRAAENSINIYKIIVFTDYDALLYFSQPSSYQINDEHTNYK